MYEGPVSKLSFRQRSESRYNTSWSYLHYSPFYITVPSLKQSHSVPSSPSHHCPLYIAVPQHNTEPLLMQSSPVESYGTFGRAEALIILGCSLPGLQPSHQCCPHSRRGRRSCRSVLRGKSCKSYYVNKWSAAPPQLWQGHGHSPGRTVTLSIVKSNAAAS